MRFNLNLIQSNMRLNKILKGYRREPSTMFNPNRNTLKLGVQAVLEYFSTKPIDA